MSLPRMTTREWMITIVIVALVTGAQILDQWSRHYQRRAGFHSRMR
jgi:hypothetical protein